MIPSFFGAVLSGAGVNLLSVTVPSLVLRVWWKPGKEFENIHSIAEEVFRDAAKVGSINIVFEQEEKTAGIVAIRRDEFEKFCGGHISALDWANTFQTTKVHKDFAIVRAGK